MKTINIGGISKQRALAAAAPMYNVSLMEPGGRGLFPLVVIVKFKTLINCLFC